MLTKVPRLGNILIWRQVSNKNSIVKGGRVMQSFSRHDFMNESPERNFAEFFAGIGLLRIGLERAGWRIAFANDIDGDKWAMYRAHFGDTGEFVLGDVHKLDVSLIPTVALATASFPRNDFSIAGEWKGLARR